MTLQPQSPFIRGLRGRITLDKIPFCEHGSRLLIFRKEASLYIRLEERWVKWRRQVGASDKRKPTIQDLVLTDENGAPMEFQVDTFPHALYFKTRAGEFVATFLDAETLHFKLPAGACGIAMRVYATAGVVDRRGGVFRFGLEHLKTHRNIAYTTNATVVSNTIEPDTRGFLRVQLQVDAKEGDGVVLHITPEFGLHRSVLPADEVLHDAEQRWHEWFAAVPAVDEKYAAQYYYAWWIMRAGLLSPRQFLSREAMSPSMVHYVGVWAWDAYFHSLAYRYVDHKLAEDQLRILLDYQREDGMLPDAVHDEGVVTRWPLPHTVHEVDVTKPPLMAWAALKLYGASHNRDFLEEIYGPAVRFHNWWFEKNDDDRDGIAAYGHPNSSGLDNSPLWDGGVPVESPDLNTYLVMQMDALSKIAGILGLDEEAERWKSDADALAQRIVAHFWDDQAGVFWAMRDHQPIPVLTPFNLYPLLTGRLPRTIADRVVARLQSEQDFWTEFPLPTVARHDPTYDPNQMWRGPTWVNINYLFIEGLVRCGYTDAARRLRDKTLELVMRHDDIYEYYNPETGDPPLYAARVFGWSSALFVDLVIHASRGEIV